MFTYTMYDTVIASPTTRDPHSTTPRDHTEQTTSHVISPAAPQEKSKDNSKIADWVYYVIALVFLVVLLIILCVVFYVCKRRSRGDKTATQMAAPTRELIVTSSFPPTDMITSLDEVHCEVHCDIIEDLPDSPPPVSLSQEPDIIQQTYSNSSSVTATPNTTISRNTNDTWPYANPEMKAVKKERGNIWKTFGKRTFFSELKKKITGSGSRSQADDMQVLERQWSHASAPVQNIPYSNPLYGQAPTSNEVEVTNSVIDAPYVLDINP